MKSQRDQLLELLATDLDFKATITLDFDTATEEFVTHDNNEEVGRLSATIERLQDTIRTLGNRNVKLQNTITDLNTKIKEWEGKAALAQAVRKPFNVHAKRPIRIGKKHRPHLSSEQVWDIRDHIKMGKGDAEIRDLMGNEFKASTIWRIRNNLAYKKVGSRPHPSTTNAKPRATAHAGHGITQGSA